MVRFIRFALICSTGACLISVAPAAWAAMYCVGTATELSAAITAASDSAEDDEVRIRTGIYQPPGPLQAYSGLFNSLSLSGGWNESCGSQVHDARLTRLEGGGTHQILMFSTWHGGNPGRSTRFSVANLHLDNGFDQGFLYGGALYMRNYSDEPAHLDIDNVIFTRNKALLGGALFVLQQRPGSTVRLNNSLFYDNSSSGRDMGHIYAAIGAGANMAINNSTFARGRCAAASVDRRCGVHVFLQGRLDVRNSLFWDNESNDLDIDGSSGATTNLERSLVTHFGGSTTPTLVAPLWGDPLFENLAAGDLRLRNDSPFINQGSVAATPVGLFAHDIHGNPRVALGRIDPGALENQTSDVIFADGFQ